MVGCKFCYQETLCVLTYDETVYILNYTHVIYANIFLSLMIWE